MTHDGLHTLTSDNRLKTLLTYNLWLCSSAREFQDGQVGIWELTNMVVWRDKRRVARRAIKLGVWSEALPVKKPPGQKPFWSKTQPVLTEKWSKAPSGLVQCEKEYIEVVPNVTYEKRKII